MKSPTLRWRLDHPRVMRGGTPGGDRQAAEAWSVRYIGEPHVMREISHPSRRAQSAPRVERLAGTRLYPVVTLYTYAVGNGEWNHGPWRVETQAELALCTDPRRPGDTEAWSTETEPDARFIEFGARHDSIDAADKAARRLAERYAGAKRPPVDWDGYAPWER